MTNIKNKHALTLLGGITPKQFFAEYWQKKPLLIRGAIADFSPILSRQDLFDLAKSQDVESRLVTHSDDAWDVKYGPFSSYPKLSQKNWTLLVQGVNLHNVAADALLRQFRFIPDARLDDLMISFASDQGGVGAHVDSYDVFLLQAEGKRRWRISAQTDLAFVDGLALKILERFVPDEEFILEPGDMLYLPPQYAHEGVALGACMTYSIGFRAPAYQELAQNFLQFMADSIDLPGMYTDSNRLPTDQPACIDTAMLKDISAELSKVEFTSDDILLFLGGYLTEPKMNVYFEPPKRPHKREKFVALLMAGGVELSIKTQMLYRGKYVFINGESFTMRRVDMPALLALANERTLGGDALSSVSSDVIDALYLWYIDGWLSVC